MFNHVHSLIHKLTQANRLLRLHTPLSAEFGPDVLLAETLKGLEGISGYTVVPTDGLAQNFTGFCLQVDALSTNVHLELKPLIGQPVLLEIQTDMSRDVLRPLHGHVTSAVCLGSLGAGSGGGSGAGRLTRYRLTIEPWLRFLSVGRDSAVFQDQNILTIVQTILADYQAGGAYQGAGKLEPVWRIDVADPSIYPLRSLTTQYQESDLAFIERLLLEEGLFYWFEHTGDTTSPRLGQHTLVIADHNGAFQAQNRGAMGHTIRFSQSGTAIQDDTIDRWRTQARWHTHAVQMSSWDYRTLDVRPIAVHAAHAEHADGGNSADDADSAGPSASAYVPEGTPALLSQDTPGAYAYEDIVQGQRLAQRQLQALSVPGKTVALAGSVRTLAPGTTFTLSGYDGNGYDPAHSTDPAPYTVLRVIHHARNNLGADLQAQARALDGIAPTATATSALDTLLASAGIAPHASPAQKTPASQADKAGGSSSDIFYRNAALALPLSVPYRATDTNATGHLIHPKPTVHGSQTALVVGVPGHFLTTERDHRIKVQFAWQRGSNSQSRLPHPTGDAGHSGAPAADDTTATTGTWVRVATPLAPQAGANWGSVALPRIGQEVLISFLGGDIDRPVVVGALYNGQGQDNAQSNQVSRGGANATGNAPMWFPGDAQAQGRSGTLPGHAHNAVLSGIKTQALSGSQSGTGAYNQLVFDDTPSQSRVGLHSHSQGAGSGSGSGTSSSSSPHSGACELNLGALRQQTDNQLLTPTGYGLELKTHHSGALRAGSGMLLSTDARAGNASGAASPQMDSREAVAQLQGAHTLSTSLSESAQAHQAMLPVLQSTEAKPAKQASAQQLEHNTQVWQSTQSGTGADNTGGGDGGGNGGGNTGGDGGGAGSAPAPSEPGLMMSGAAGVALLTPQSATFNAGNTTSITAGHDINLMAQGNAAQSVKGGISMFAYGKASNPNKPNTEVGVKLHAASGKLSSQSQSSRTLVTADKSITVASTTDSVMIQAPKHVLLTAGGAYIKLDGMNIDIHAPGMVDFKATMKNWTGPKSSSIESVNMPVQALVPPKRYSQRLNILGLIGADPETGNALVHGMPYKVTDSKGNTVATGVTDSQGNTQPIYTEQPEKVKVQFGQGSWLVLKEVNHGNN
jgi:type VI secretion system secreted protein VgrG